jgi:hypothetical protein
MHPNNTHNKTLHHTTTTNWERTQQKSHVNYAVVTNVVPLQKPRHAASNSKLLHHGTMPLEPRARTHTHTQLMIPFPVKLQHKTPVVASVKTTDPDHSAWGSHIFHRLALLFQGLRYLKPLREQHLRPAVAGDTIAPCTPTQVLQYTRALCTFLPTRTKHTSFAVVRKQHQQPTATTAWPSPRLQM